MKIYIINFLLAFALCSGLQGASSDITMGSTPLAVVHQFENGAAFVDYVAQHGIASLLPTPPSESDTKRKLLKERMRASARERDKKAERLAQKDERDDKATLRSRAKKADKAYNNLLDDLDRAKAREKALEERTAQQEKKRLALMRKLKRQQRLQEEQEQKERDQQAYEQMLLEKERATALRTAEEKRKQEVESVRQERFAQAQQEQAEGAARRKAKREAKKQAKMVEKAAAQEAEKEINKICAAMKAFNERFSSVVVDPASERNLTELAKLRSDSAQLFALDHSALVDSFVDSDRAESFTKISDDVPHRVAKMLVKSSMSIRDARGNLYINVHLSGASDLYYKVIDDTDPLYFDCERSYYRIANLRGPVVMQRVI